jgi:uncharacterized membrane protein HdeD (DUF308 family)
MNTSNTQTGLKPLEVGTVSVGLVLAGIAIAITGVSYILNMTFTYQWLVWVLGIAFVVVGILTMAWPLAFRRPKGDVPTGSLRQFLIISIPLVFVLDSQICGLGLKACTVVCHVLFYALAVLAVIVAIRVSQGKSIAPYLVPMVILSLVPHCVCHAPINVIWHNLFGGYAPTCFMMPLAAALFAVMALRGVWTRLSTVLVVLMLVVITFIAVCNPLLGFPWQGCMG